MARMFRNRSKEPEKITESNVVVGETISEELETVNTQEEKPEDVFKEKEVVENTLEIQESIKLHNHSIPLEHKPHHSKKDNTGLSGNPGQKARFNHMMESKGGDTSKYFHSGKK